MDPVAISSDKGEILRVGRPPMWLYCCVPHLVISPSHALTMGHAHSCIRRLNIRGLPPSLSECPLVPSCMGSVTAHTHYTPSLTFLPTLGSSACTKDFQWTNPTLWKGHTALSRRLQLIEYLGTRRQQKLNHRIHRIYRRSQITHISHRFHTSLISHISRMMRYLIDPKSLRSSGIASSCTTRHRSRIQLGYQK